MLARPRARYQDSATPADAAGGADAAASASAASAARERRVMRGPSLRRSGRAPRSRRKVGTGPGRRDGRVEVGEAGPPETREDAADMGDPRPGDALARDHRQGRPDRGRRAEEE